MKKTTVDTAITDLLVLQAKNLNPGTIETNIETVLEAVKEKSRQYQDLTKYAGDDKQAKEDRALLRKQKDMTKTTIVSIQEMWNRPLEQFLSGGKEILKQFDFAIDTIDAWVKEGETVLKERKREEIQAFFETKNFDLVPLDKIFSPRWLNKTVSMKDIKEEIEKIILDIKTSIKTLESIAEYGMTAKAFYLETLDMAEAMRRVETLKANAERLAREKIERAEKERQAQVTSNAIEERSEKNEEKTDQRVKSLALEALEMPEPEMPEEPEILEFTLRFRGTKEQLFRLREYMTTNGIAYTKL